MSAERDVNRIVRSWIRTEEHESADRVLQTVLSRLDATPQRRSRLPAWRTFRMSRLAILAATAAVLVVALVGYNLIPGLRILGPGATPSPSSAEPSTAGDGSLPVGPRLMVPVGSQHGEDRVTVTIPAPGWLAPDSGSLTKDLGGGDSVTVVVVPGDYYRLPPNICNWRVPFDQRDTYPPARAEGLVAYVEGQTYDTPDGSLTRAFSTPEAISIDGSYGQRIVNTVREYPESDRTACDEQRFCTLLDRDSYGCLLSHTEPGALDTLWAVNPGEERIYILVVASSGSPGAGLREEMNTLVGSMTFYAE